MGQVLKIQDVCGRVDFAIITIRVDEFDAVLKRFEPRQPVEGGKHAYEYCRFTAAGGNERNVAMVRCLEQGPTKAQSVTHDVIDELDPRWLILAGIAGGVPADEFSLGDVLLASRLHDFSVSAALEGRKTEYDQRGGPVHRAVEHLLGGLPAWRERLGNWNSAASVGHSKPEVSVPRALSSDLFYGNEETRRRVRASLLRHFPVAGDIRPPFFHIGASAVAGLLVKDAELLTQWRESARSVTHVEMEAGGAYEAARTAGQHEYPLLCVRGISDIVGFKRHRDWTTYACNTAASLIRALVCSGAITLGEVRGSEQRLSRVIHRTTGLLGGSLVEPSRSRPGPVRDARGDVPSGTDHGVAQSAGSRSVSTTSSANQGNDVPIQTQPSTLDVIGAEFVRRIATDGAFCARMRKDIITPLAVALQPGCVRVFFVNGERQQHVSHMEYNPRGFQAARDQGRYEGLVGWTLEYESPSYYPNAPDTLFHGRYRPTDSRVVAEVVVPLTLDEEVVGAVLADWETVGAHDLNVRKWQSMRPDTTIDRVQQCANELASRLDERYTKPVDLREVAESPLKHCCTRTHSTRGYVALWTHNGSLAYVAAGIGTEKFLCLYPTEGICGTALRTGLVQNPADLLSRSDSVVSDQDLRGELAVPIRKGDVVIGVLNLERPRGPYSAAEVKEVCAVAEKIGASYRIDPRGVREKAAVMSFAGEDLSEQEIESCLSDYARCMLKTGDARVRPPNTGEGNPFDLEPIPHIIPIAINGRTHRVLEVTVPGERAVSRDVLDRLQMCAQLAANALRRADRVRRRELYAELLARMARMLPRRVDLVPVLRDIVRTANTVLGSSHTTLFWPSPDDPELFVPGVSTAACLYSSMNGARGYKAGLGVTGWVIANRLPICVRSLKDQEELKTLDPALQWTRTLSETAFDHEFVQTSRSFMAWPVLDPQGQNCIGVFRTYIEEHETSPGYTATDQRMLETIAAEATVLVWQATRARCAPAVEIRWAADVPAAPRGAGLAAIAPQDPPQLRGYSFSAQRAREARDADRLLSIRLETSLKCDLSCIYCCNDAGVPRRGEIGLAQRVAALREARDLGAESVVFIGGGEFLLHRDWETLLLESKKLQLTPVVFTNGIRLAEDVGVAHTLEASNASVIIKLDSLDWTVQGRLSGGRRSFVGVPEKALRNLLRAGYEEERDTRSVRLGASCVVTRMNYEGVPAIWAFCRERGLFPNLEWLVLNGRAATNEGLVVSLQDMTALRKRLLEYDEQHYGYSWVPYTPRIGSGCLQFMYSLYITYDGWLRPCASIHVDTRLNVKSVTLREAMQQGLYKLARNVDKHVRGRCKACEHSYVCCGCRGVTYTALRMQNKAEEEALVAEDLSCPLCQQVPGSVASC